VVLPELSGYDAIAFERPEPVQKEEHIKNQQEVSNDFP
jgi:hypothetical protein